MVFCPLWERWRIGLVLILFMFGLGLPGTLQAGWLRSWGALQMVPPGDDYVGVAAGHNQTLGLRQDGSIVSWGYGGTFLPAPAGTGYTALAAGVGASVAIAADGSLVAWRADGEPVGFEVPAGNDFVDISMLDQGLAIALRADGTLAPWRLDDGGECPIPEGNDFVDVAVGSNSMAALKSDGSIVRWSCEFPDPFTPPGLAGNDFVAIDVGANHVLALKEDGSLAADGSNLYGQLLVPEGNDFVAIAVGHNHSLALREDGTVAAWGGTNFFRELNVPPGNDYQAIAAGWYHSVAIIVPEPSTLAALLSMAATAAFIAWRRRR